MTQLTDPVPNPWQPFVATTQIDPALREVMVVLREGYQRAAPPSEQVFAQQIDQVAADLEAFLARWRRTDFVSPRSDSQGARTSQEPATNGVLAAARPTALAGRPADLLREMAPRVPLLVALDLDGTVVNAVGEVSERVRQAVSALQQAGAAVVISTGRSVMITSPVARLLGLDRVAMVCSNGALGGVLSGIQGAEPLFAPQFIHTFDVSQVVREVRQLLPDSLLAVEDVPHGFRATGRFPDGELQELTEIVTLEELVSRPVCRLVVRDPAMSLDDFTQVLQRANLEAVEFSIGWTSWVDISPPGVSKASGLAELAAAWGIAQENVVAVGDGANDVEMIQWAGLGVAMGNAEEGPKQVADLVIPSVENDGAAALMQALARACQER